MEEDNWSDQMTFQCASCMFFVPKNETSIGRCRKHSPSIDGWPVVHDSDWCGDHKLTAQANLVEFELIEEDEEEEDDDD